MTPDEWLDSRCGNETILDRLAELVCVNGGARVHGWGFIRGGGTPYGRGGLEQDEALQLIELNGIMTGFGLALGQGAYDRMCERIVERIKRQAAMLAVGGGDAAPHD